MDKYAQRFDGFLWRAMQPQRSVVDWLKLHCNQYSISTHSSNKFYTITTHYLNNISLGTNHLAINLQKEEK